VIRDPTIEHAVLFAGWRIGAPAGEYDGPPAGELAMLHASQHTGPVRFSLSPRR
jgi:hypothetical protein